MTRRGFLIVGGDSVIGMALAQTLVTRGHRVVSTTRRIGTTSAARIFLDLSASHRLDVPRGVDHAYLLAAATSFGLCETDPEAHRINLVAVPKLAAHLLEQGVAITFLSSSAVFGGDRPWPGEHDLHCATNAYARHKLDGETMIRAHAAEIGALDRVSIVRITKVLTAATPPLVDWFEAWRGDRIVTPFSDLLIAPVSLPYVCTALAKIAEPHLAGTFHLSGATEVDYATLASALADAIGIGTADCRIVPVTSQSKGVSLHFKPRYPGLGMFRTSALTGISPQPLEALVGDLLADRLAGATTSHG